MNLNPEALLELVATDKDGKQRKDLYHKIKADIAAANVQVSEARVLARDLTNSARAHARQITGNAEAEAKRILADARAEIAAEHGKLDQKRTQINKIDTDAKKMMEAAAVLERDITRREGVLSRKEEQLARSTENFDRTMKMIKDAWNAWNS